MKPYSRVQRQYLHLAERLQSMVQNGTWEGLSPARQNHLVQKLQRLLGQLRNRFSRRSLTRALGTAAFLLWGGSALPAQSFAPPVNNPFGLAGNGSGYYQPAFADLDNDGDLDLLVTNDQANFIYFQNNGTSTSPLFAPGTLNPFGLARPFQNSYELSLTIGDLDNDGDNDVLLGEYLGEFYYYQNTGSAAAPAFGAPATAPFGLTNFPNFYNSPAFNDLDGDGDLDVISGAYNGALYQFINTGTATSPSFGFPNSNPHGANPPTDDFSKPGFADVDNDGDTDMVTGGDNGDIVYYPNTGTPTAPAFAPRQVNPSGLANIGVRSAPAFADVDGDGDEDLFAMESAGNFVFFENTLISCTNSASTISPTACDSYSAPSGAVYSTSGTYTDVIPNASGCDSTITINLTVNQSTAASITATGCQSYTSPSGNVIVMSGVYGEVIPNSVGCDSNLTITLNLTTIDMTVLNDGAGTLTATTTGVSYQWYSCTNNAIVPGATGPSFSPTSIGDYAVILMKAGCRDTSICNFVGVVGTQASQLPGVKLYPNPGQDQFAVDLGRPMNDVEIAVYDLQGREIYRRRFDAGRILPVQLRPAAGLYQVKISSPEGDARLKWTVE